MMNQWIITAGAGLVSGILYARMHAFPAAFIPWFLTIGLILAVLSIILLSARKPFRLFVFASLALIGIANTTWHQQTDTPGHLSLAVSRLQDDTGITLEGAVFQPPDIRETYTIVPLKVIRLHDSDGLPVTVRRGNVYVRLYPSVGDIYHAIGYGDRIEFTGVQLQAPDPPANPGAFNMQRFLNNQGYYATLNVRRPEQINHRATGAGNPLIRVSEAVKHRLLTIIRQTLPYPESTFLGGVLLGLRSGLSGDVRETFRAAGVAHVLAVSGLHVTIITLFFMGMFKILRVPRMSSFIIIIAALLLFTLITGARPSTVRAAIMNGVTLLFFYFRGIKLDRSFLLGISVAAIYILLRNPLLISEAAFLFSFSAVLSLALMTRPVFQFCTVFLRGFFRVFLFFGAIIILATLLVLPVRPADIRHLLIAWPLLLVAGAVADRYLPPFFEFRRLPTWFSTFFAAQIGIQFGMLPLTAFFFNKISVAAPLANFIAIPLIGIIVQLGFFAGILGSIPIVGIYPALALNAANWLFIRLFLTTADFFGTRFPYPDVSSPNPAVLIAYYCALLLFAAWPWFNTRIGPQIRYVLTHWRSPPILARLALLLLLIGIPVGHTGIALHRRTPRLTVTVLDPVVFFSGGGNAIHIRTPGGKNYLVDGGPKYDIRRNEPVPINIGSRVTLPALLELNSRHLDGIILSGADGRAIGAVPDVLENQWFTVRDIYHALPFDTLSPDWSPEDILLNLDDPALFRGNQRRRSELTAWALRDVFSVAEAKHIPLTRVRAGDIIVSETIRDPVTGSDKTFAITVLNPPAERYTGQYSVRSNCIVLHMQYADTGILLNYDAGRSVQSDMLERHPPPFQVIQLAANGADHALNHEWTALADTAIVASLPSRWAQRNIAGTRQMIRSIGLDFFDTRQDGALTIVSDGSDITIRGFHGRAGKEEQQ